jgi:hypothetical protein
VPGRRPLCQLARPNHRAWHAPPLTSTHTRRMCASQLGPWVDLGPFARGGQVSADTVDGPSARLTPARACRWGQGGRCLFFEEAALWPACGLSYVMDPEALTAAYSPQGPARRGAPGARPTQAHPFCSGAHQHGCVSGWKRFFALLALPSRPLASTHPDTPTRRRGFHISLTCGTALLAGGRLVLGQRKLPPPLLVRSTDTGVLAE